jgi:DNA-binding NtrC family response regulator
VTAETVLVIDYEQNIRQLVVSLLDGAGYQVFQAESAESALRILEQLNVNLVICNTEMPDMSGVELALRAQEAQPDLKVLLTTGHIRPDQPAASRPAKPGVFEQPLRPEVLLTEIRRILRDPDREHTA